MKRLILIRHAKSSWDAPHDDHARSLNDRGRKAATKIGHWLRDQCYAPDQIYCSDAARTRETTDAIVDALGTTPNIHPLRKLYHASSTTLMKTVQAAKGNTIALVAHNPGIADFADKIVANAPNHDRFWDYPTGATLVCDMPENDWAEVVSHSGRVVDFIVPKDLSD